MKAPVMLISYSGLTLSYAERSGYEISFRLFYKLKCENSPLKNFSWWKNGQKSYINAIHQYPALRDWMNQDC